MDKAEEIFNKLWVNSQELAKNLNLCDLESCLNIQSINRETDRTYKKR